MENLKLKGTSRTPEVDFNTNGIVKISGRSIPENSIEFYDPLFVWLSEFCDKIELHINLEYYNTSSSKCLLQVFNLVEKNEGSFCKWFYEDDDEDMLEAGEDFEDSTNIPFEMISYED